MLEGWCLETVRVRSGRTSSVPGGLASFIRQQLTVLLTHGNEELVDGHRRINRDFAAEEVLNIVLLCIGDRVASRQGRRQEDRWPMRGNARE
jgi:hypothetical protein